MTSKAQEKMLKYQRIMEQTENKMAEVKAKFEVERIRRHTELGSEVDAAGLATTETKTLQSILKLGKLAIEYGLHTKSEQEVIQSFKQTACTDT